jgi:hypothetical protein
VNSSSSHILSSTTERGHSVFITYFGAVAAGFFLYLGLIVLRFIIYPKQLEGASLVLWCLVLWLVYALVGSWFGSLPRTKAIPLGFCLLAFYLLLTIWSVSNMIQSNQTYGGWFWVNKFFFAPIVL